jgi:hypothetical protein
MIGLPDPQKAVALAIFAELQERFITSEIAGGIRES